VNDFTLFHTRAALLPQYGACERARAAAQKEAPAGGRQVAAKIIDDYA
jgi:hypothetical protein